MSVAVELTAGGIAGSLGILSTQPMDTIRIRLQSSANSMGILGSYGGVFDCAQATLRKEGIRGLYKGVASPTITVGIMNAVLFFSYENASALVKRNNHIDQSRDLTFPQVMLAGGAAGFATSFVTAPTELVKCIAQTNLKSKGYVREEWTIFQSMLREHGWLGAHGPCRGLMTTMIRETPSFSLYFAVYEAGIRRYGKSDLVSFVSGGCAGALAWTVIYPLDVIKTRWQIATPGLYTSLRHCFQTSVAQEGWKVLFRGYCATMIRAWPQNGIIFCSYEFVKNLIS